MATTSTLGVLALLGLGCAGCWAVGTALDLTLDGPKPGLSGLTGDCFGGHRPAPATPPAAAQWRSLLRPVRQAAWKGDTVRTNRSASSVRAVIMGRDAQGQRLAPEGTYAVVASADAATFARTVTERLHEGYQLRGEMHTERTGPTTFVYLQNMVKERPY